MDRINKFLAKRPQKHKKILHFRNKTYEVTKEDLKKVRAYRGGKCLDPSFKLTRPLDLSFSAIPGEALVVNKKKRDRSEETRRAVLEKLAKRRPRRLRVEKNVIRDVWEDDTIETLRNYKQEWLYSINHSYDSSIENCNFTQDDLKEELRRVFLHYYRPRDVNEKRLEDLLPKLPEVQDLRPFPEVECTRWIRRGSAYMCGSFACISKDKSLVCIDLECGKVVYENEVEESIRKVCFYSPKEILLLTTHKIYTLAEGSVVERFYSESPIKDIAAGNSKLYVLVYNTLNIYDYSTSEAISSEVIRHKRPHKLKMVDDSLFIATAGGIIRYTEPSAENRTLNYVVDFTSYREKLLIVNNMKRLVVLGKKLDLKQSVVQPGIGKEIKAHSILNLFAILFDNEVRIYKFVENQYVPVHVIPG